MTIALCSYLLYASFDLLSRAYVGHRLGTALTLSIAAVCYAFNVNLGALVGGVGFRWRLYARFGLRTGQVMQIYACSVTTNWTGYVVLMGTVLSLDLVVVPESWRAGLVVSRALGALLLLVALAYLALCTLLPRRTLTVRGQTTLHLPSIGFATAQVILSAVNWLVMAGLIHLLLRQQVGYGDVLGTLLLAAITGVIAHIPAGLGVLEAVFLVMLSQRVASHEVIAALLVYRASYYLVPLLLALPLYGLLELGASRVERVARGDP